jgi:hypothetical protein
LAAQGRDSPNERHGARDYFQVVQATRSGEQNANVYYKSDGWRYPAILFLHNIV